MGRSPSSDFLRFLFCVLDDSIFLLFPMGYFLPDFPALRTAPLIHVTYEDATYMQLEEKLPLHLWVQI